MVERSFNPMAGKRFADQALQTFHTGPQFLASSEGDYEPSDRGIFHSLTCQLSSLPREEFNRPHLRKNEGAATAQANPPKERALTLWQGRTGPPLPQRTPCIFLHLPCFATPSF